VSEQIHKEFLQALKITVAGDKQEPTLRARVAGVGLADVCSRCGGSGEYSFCQAHGTTCFKCSGTGKTMPRLTVKLLERVKQAVAEGKLDEYFTRAKSRAKLKPLASSLNGFVSLWFKDRYDANGNPVRETELEIAALKLSIELARLVADALKDCNAIIYRRGGAPKDEAVLAAVAKAEAVFARRDAMREELSKLPGFCAARFYRAEDYSSFFTNKFEVTIPYYNGKSETVNIGAVDAEDARKWGTGKHGQRGDCTVVAA